MSTIANANQKILMGIPSSSPERILVNHPTQSSAPLDGWKAALFGLPFLAAGIWILYAAFRRSQPGDAPVWVIATFGVFFALAGVFFILHGILGVVRKAAYDREARESAGQSWLRDYRWQREGFTFSAFKAMLQRLVAALVWTGFLAPFFYIGMTVRGAFFFLIVASLLGLVGLVFWYRWAQMLAELFRYGNTILLFDSFPYFLGGTLRARLRAPNHLADIGQLTLTLRCVQEKYITSGTGSNRKTQVVCFELFSAAQSFSAEQLAAFAGGDIPVEFALPADQPATALALPPPVYWEIEARGASKRVSLEAYYLVPVYKTA